MDFLEVISKRHSVRQYAPTKIDRSVLDHLVLVAQTAPSSKNCQSSGFMIVEDPDTIAALSCMRRGGSAFMKDAPAAIVVLGDSTKTDLWDINASISATFIQLSAVNEGLGSCWVHVKDRPRSKDGSVPGNAEDYVRELLGVRAEMRILCVIALGVPLETPVEK